MPPSPQPQYEKLWQQKGSHDAMAGLELSPKGSCWYCDKPVDQVRKFCSKDCRKDYQEESLLFSG